MLKPNRFDKFTNDISKHPMFWPIVVTLYIIALAVFSYAFIHWIR